MENYELDFGHSTDESGELTPEKVAAIVNYTEPSNPVDLTQDAKIEIFRESLINRFPNGFPSQKYSKSNDKYIPPYNGDDYTDYFGE